MKPNEIKMPLLPGEGKGNDPRPVSAEKKDRVIAGGQFAPQVGAEYEFTVSEDGTTAYAVEQDVIRNGQKTGFSTVNVSCMKNGKPSWLSLGILHRADNTFTPVHPVAKDLMAQGTIAGALSYLLNKKVKCVAIENKTFNKFGENGTEERATPIFEWA